MRSERRLHPASFLFVIASNLRRMLLPLLVAVFAARSSSWDVWIGLGLIVSAVYGLVRYLTYRYIYAEDDLIIKTGFIFRNERHIPYIRIHNIGSVQNLLHRLVGVVETRVETAGGSEPEARLQVLSVGAMEEMRGHVLAAKRRAGGPVEAAPGAGATLEAGGVESVAIEGGRTLLHLTPKELFLHGIIDYRGMIVVGAAMGLWWELGWMGGDGFLDVDRWFDMNKDTGRSVMRYLAGALSLGGIGQLAAGLLLFLVALHAFSIGYAFWKLYGFTLQRSGRDLVMTCGLFTRVSTTIPLLRIQVVTIREKPLHRLFGRVEVRVDTAGGGESEEAVVSHQRIAPLVKRADLPRLIQELQPGLDLPAVDWRSVDPRASRRILKVWALMIAGLTAVAVANVGPWGAIVAVPLIPLAIVGARLHAASLRYALTDEWVLYRSGWLWTHVSMARHSKIQALQAAESPFDRRWDMAHLRVDTAGAGKSAHLIHIPYLPKGTALDLFRRLEVQAARTAFRW